MRSLRRIPSLALLSFFVMAGCTDSPTTAPEQPPSAPTVSLGLGVSKEEEKRLERMLDLEKERLKEAKEASKAEFEAAREEWKAFEHEWKEAHKGDEHARSKLLRCEPLEYDGESKIIGPAGGSIKMGPHELEIPKGALPIPVVITGEAPTTSLVQVDFAPHGLVFLKQPTLTLSYKHCMQPAEFTQEVVYLGPGNKVLERPASDDKKMLEKVQAWIDHFSRYAVAYRR
ncbi:MAG: hypothetical protein WKG32_15240 [Gemmatimonadaceae bacterium]